MKCFIPLLLAGTLAACKSDNLITRDVQPVEADSAMVVSAHPLATKVGIDILKKGGNAVDAAVAVQFVLAVVHPAAGNLGGGGFMLYREAGGTVYSLDYREKAPERAETTMFLDDSLAVIPGLSESSHLASGVPGSVAGMWESHQRFGSLPWKDLVEPAITLAINGFELTDHEAEGLRSIQEELRTNNSVVPEHLIRDWQEGDRLVLSDLGHALERIRDHGPAGFYSGKTGDLIVAEMRRGGGLITNNDLLNYKAVWRKPIRDNYRHYTVISMPPPSSGGVALLQLLKSVEPYPIREWGHNTAKTIHLYTEAERRVYADRAAYLGDPDFFDVPLRELLDTRYVRARMSSFDKNRATSSADVKEGTLLHYESEQTTHLSVIDAKGNAVAVTTTLNDSYGSRIVVAGAGFFLNNEMDDFSVKPGHPNMYGAIGGEANKILSGKRMLSSMTPTILEKDGELYMVVGTPGGTTIITSVFQTILNVVEFDMNMQEAVSIGRVHSQWLPDEIQAERMALSDEDIVSLEEMGHRIVFRDPYGRVDAIRIREDGKLEGGADPRGDDTASGY